MEAIVTNSTIERELADLLLSAYDAGYCHAAGIPIESPQSPYLRQLLTTIAQRHATEVLAMRAWADPPLSRQIPAWLRELAAQDAGELKTMNDERRTMNDER